LLFDYIIPHPTLHSFPTRRSSDLIPLGSISPILSHSATTGGCTSSSSVIPTTTAAGRFGSFQWMRWAVLQVRRAQSSSAITTSRSEERRVGKGCRFWVGGGG